MSQALGYGPSVPAYKISYKSAEPPLSYDQKVKSKKPKI